MSTVTKLGAERRADDRSARKAEGGLAMKYLRDGGRVSGMNYY